MARFFNKPKHFLYLGIILGASIGVISGLKSGNLVGDLIIGLILGGVLGYYVSLFRKGPLNESTLSHVESLRKYPFKYMVAIIELMKNNKNVRLGQVREVSGACTPDALETLDMMQFLTVQGQVIKVDNKWKFTPRTHGRISEPKRISYLSTFLDLINILEKDDRDFTDLQQLNIVPPSDLEEYLQFLSILTAQGIVRKKVNPIDILTQRGRIYCES
jgi:hypothetical protein